MLASRCHVDSFICNMHSEEIAIILPEWQELEEVWGHIRCAWFVSYTRLASKTKPG
jgi:hypothetical protein